LSHLRITLRSPVIVSGSPPGVADSRDIIRAQFLPCDGGDPGTVVLPEMNQICVVTSSQDTVVPETLIRPGLFENSARQVAWVESKVRSHRSFDGGDRCLQKVIGVNGVSTDG
ncbi:hypothetical protein, partial [Micromonospora sp. LOL_015]|uniref:hypothetical protein n=1 Tax=Micromonospora sp. LOL_015 TaxID=3345416 RepID=UPI003A8A9919